MTTIKLKPKRDNPTRHRHPWIFSGAIAEVKGSPQRGETVAVTNDHGELLGFGAWSPESQIRIRMWDFGDCAPIDETFFNRRVQDALAIRSGMTSRFETNALRLINAEADGLPGVTVDIYDTTLVGQFTTAGAETNKHTIVKALMSATGATSFYERSDGDGRLREGLEQMTGRLAGDEPPNKIHIHEREVNFEVDVRLGHKTGFYLDQRENRRIIATYAQGQTVLNTFAFTGGFGIAAQAAGAAHVTHIDISGTALEQAKINASLNVNHEAVTFQKANVFEALRTYRDKAATFDIVVLDPPKFAETRSQTMKALRGYKDINLLGIKLVQQGGLLATFSCSGAIDPQLFRTMVTEAAHDAGRDVRILSELRQAPDHVEALSFPEGFYLKGLLCRVL
ncbi:MAG: class I SAM-dependent methyltransferase [bacterium]|nr:class I SAM-dependent methyltransferase [bacterium]